MQIKTSGKKKTVQLSKSEWLAIGKKTGWTEKYAQTLESSDQTSEPPDLTSEIEAIYLKMNESQTTEFTYKKKLYNNLDEALEDCYSFKVAGDVYRREY